MLWPTINQNQRGEFQVAQIFNRSAADALREAYRHVALGIRAAREADRAAGQSLLVQLAAGEITNDQFNARRALGLTPGNTALRERRRM